MPIGKRNVRSKVKSKSRASAAVGTSAHHLPPLHSIRGPIRGERWVVKAGSQMITQGGPLLIRDWMRQLARLREVHQIQVIWVTSGAIAMATERTSFKKSRTERNLAEKQALSAIGQPIMMDLYNLALQSSGLLGSQILLTADDLHHSHRRSNFISSVEQLLAWGVVPVLNENDAISTDEIQFGDNDSLSAQVACHTKADRLVILTDVEGLFDRDPSGDPHAELIRHVPRVDEKMIRAVSGGSVSAHGTGGMFTKLRAAKTAQTKKIVTHLIRGDRSRALLSIAERQDVGTRIGAEK